MSQQQPPSGLWRVARGRGRGWAAGACLTPATREKGPNLGRGHERGPGRGRIRGTCRR